MKDLDHPVKGSLDPLPTYRESIKQLYDLELLVDNIIDKLDTVNLRLTSLEFNLLIGRFKEDENEDM